MTEFEVGTGSRLASTGEHSFNTVSLPSTDAPEGALIQGVTVIPVDNLVSLVGHLNGFQPIPAYEAQFDFDADDPPPYAADFSKIKAGSPVQHRSRSVLPV